MGHSYLMYYMTGFIMIPVFLLRLLVSSALSQISISIQKSQIQEV